MAANTPDVRVRLSAEGVQEVVAAFKRIQAEAEKTAKQSKLAAEGHAFLNKQLASLKELLPALAAGAIVAGFIEMSKRGLELADNLGKLQQKTGLAADTISTFSFAARFADVEQESLAKGLVKFTKAMDDYDKGASKARGAIANLFGNENALKGLGMDQRLQKIVEKLATLEPGAKRTGAAIALFGKAGAELLPLMDELGTEGFDKLSAKAKKLGLDLSKDARDAAENLKRSMITLSAEAEGMATQFLMGMAPQVANAVDGITEATAGAGVNGFKVVGKAAGYAINGIVAGFIIVGKTMSFIVSEGVELFKHFGDYVQDTLKGTWTLIKAAAGMALGQGATAFLNDSDFKRLEGGGNKFLFRLARFGKDVKKSMDDLFTEKPAPKKKPGDTSSSGAEDEGKAAKAAMDLAQAQADARLKVENALQRQQEAAERERYEKGLESLREYYANRLKIVEQQGQAELDAAQAKVDALKKAPLAKGELQDERQAKIVAAQAEVDAKRIDLQTQTNALRAEEAKETEALQQKALDFEKKIAQAQGDRFTQAKAGIDAEANALDELLRKQGIAQPERQRRVSAFTQAGYQQVDFERLQHDAAMALDELERKRQAIDLQVQGGQLFAFQGEQQIMTLEKQRLPQLQQIADAMKKTAFTPEQVQAAEEFQAKIDQLSVSSNKAAQEMAEFKQNVEASLTSDLSNWLSDGIDQADNLADAFRGLALSVVQSLRQIVSQMLATYLMKKMLGSLFPDKDGEDSSSGGSGSSGGGGGGLLGFLGGLFGGGHAEGGLIRGPGTATSDSIPARLSNGEYVVRATAVRRIGVEALNALNFGTPRVRRRGTSRFAEGGLVDVPAAGGASSAGISATLDLDHILLLKRLEASPEFDRVIVRTLGNNKKAVGRALGS